MPIYRFRCHSCGPFEAQFPMSAVPDAHACPVCGAGGRRTITAAHVGRGSSAVMRALDETKRSATEPGVVSGPTPGRRRAAPVTTDPIHRTLPRP